MSNKNLVSITVESLPNAIKLQLEYFNNGFDWVDAIKNGKGRPERSSGFNMLQILYNNSYFDIDQHTEDDRCIIKFYIPDETGKYIGSKKFSYINSLSVYKLHYMQVNIEEDLGTILNMGYLFATDYIVLEVVSNIEKYCKVED